MDFIRFMKETMRAVGHDLPSRPHHSDALLSSTANKFEKEFHRFVMEDARWEARTFGDLMMYRSPQGGAWMPLSDAFLVAHQSLV